MAAMKRNATKNKSTASAARKARIHAAQQMTGAPSAGFLSELEIEAPIGLLITGTRDQRKSNALVTSDEIGKRIWMDLLELADRVSNPKWTGKSFDDLESAENLAYMANSAAMLLEHLASSKEWMVKKLISAAAQKMEFWAVPLRRGVKKGKPSLEGVDKAKAYLNDIKLGKHADSGAVLKYFNDGRANIFKRAAELLLYKLVSWREHGAWRGEITDWAKELYALKLPMRSADVDAWWSVAKQWMDEQWETNPEIFKPLIASCKSKGKSLAGDRHEHYPSQVRRDVIDVRLREVFFALAK